MHLIVLIKLKYWLVIILHSSFNKQNHIDNYAGYYEIVRRGGGGGINLIIIYLYI